MGFPSTISKEPMGVTFDSSKIVENKEEDGGKEFVTFAYDQINGGGWDDKFDGGMDEGSGGFMAESTIDGGKNLEDNQYKFFLIKSIRLISKNNE